MRKRYAVGGHDRSAVVFILVLCAYFLLHIVIRIGMPDSLELDEAEQAFFFQQLRLGYGAQPPLYAWLQWLVFSVFGVNLFALSLLKNLLLFATYLAMFRLAIPLVGVSGAIVASASMILLPSIGFESHVDRTHSVLLTCLACSTLWCYFALLRNQSVTRYALFGLLVGLGLQAKYNFALFIAGLASASFLSPDHRRILWNRKAWVAVAIALLVLLPHGTWLLNHLEAATTPTLSKLDSSDRDAGYLHNVGRGLANLLVATLAFITPLWLVYGLAGRRFWNRAAIAWHSADAQFFVRLYVASFAFIVLLVLSGEVSTIRSRWLQPLLFSVPLAFFVVLPGMAHRVVFRRILHAAGLVAVLIPVLLWLRAFLGPALDRHVRLHHPYPQLSSELARQFPYASIVVAEDTLVAGNLYFQRPTLRTLTVDQVLGGTEQVAGEVLLVMRPDTKAGWRARFRDAYPFSTVLREGRLYLRYGYGGKQVMPFDYALVRVDGR